MTWFPNLEFLLRAPLAVLYIYNIKPLAMEVPKLRLQITQMSINQQIIPRTFYVGSQNLLSNVIQHIRS